MRLQATPKADASKRDSAIDTPCPITPAFANLTWLKGLLATHHILLRPQNGVAGWFVGRVYHYARKHSYMMQGLTIILNPLKILTYEEIVELPNGELTQRIDLAFSQLIEAEKHHENIAEKVQIYQTCYNERIKRLTFVKRKRVHFVSCRL
jgi:hypothetical protein